MPGKATLPACFDTVFNSVEPIPPERLEVSMHHTHQRIKTPALDEKAIEETWANLVDTQCKRDEHLRINSSDIVASVRNYDRNLASATKIVLNAGGGGGVSHTAAVSPPIANVSSNRGDLDDVDLDEESVCSSSNSSIIPTRSISGPPPPNAYPVSSTPVVGWTSALAQTRPRDAVEESPCPSTPFLFNGMKFRLHDVIVATASGSPPEMQPFATSTSSIADAPSGIGAPAREYQHTSRPKEHPHPSSFFSETSQRHESVLRQTDDDLANDSSVGDGNTATASTTASQRSGCGGGSGQWVPRPGAVTRTLPVMQCLLQLGLTDYKTSLGTCKHISRYWKYSRERASVANSGKLRRTCSATHVLPVNDTPVDSHALAYAEEIENMEKYLANALGVEALAVTNDHKAVLFRRSTLVSEYPGYYCCPGGHPEPTHIFNLTNYKRHTPTSDHASLLQYASLWFENLAGDNVTRELYSSIEVEVSDEIGVSRELCKNRGLLSLIRNTQTRKPDLCFWVQVNCSSDVVRQKFVSRCGTEAFESDEGSLVFLDLLSHTTVEDMVKFVNTTLNGCITPASYACLIHGALSMRHRMNLQRQ